MSHPLSSNVIDSLWRSTSSELLVGKGEGVRSFSMFAAGVEKFGGFEGWKVVEWIDSERKTTWKIKCRKNLL